MEEKDWTRYQKSEKGLLYKVVEILRLEWDIHLTIITGDHSYEITIHVSPEEDCEAGIVLNMMIRFTMPSA